MIPEGSDSTAPGSFPEVRRRRREGWIILATAVAVVLFAVFETRMPPSAVGQSLGTDAILVALINLNLILLALLVFLVGRNIVKLILDRRRRAMGSHLRTRLVVAFVAIALLPATLLFAVALSFVTNSVENWFNSEVENALKGSLQVARAYYEDLGHTALGFARTLSRRVADEGLWRQGRREALRRFLDEHREEFQIDLLEVFGTEQKLAHSKRTDLPEHVGTPLAAPLVRDAITEGREGTVVNTVGESDVIRAAVPIRVEGLQVGAVVVNAYVPRSVVQRREDIDRSFAQFLRLKIQQRPIQTAYTITLALVTLVVIFAATWVAFYVARGITVPIQRLAEGTRAVAQGDLDQHIEGEGDDEIGTLVGAFNAMTDDLKTSRTELEERRRYLEIVLGNITAGVISTDSAGRVTTLNVAAASLLGLARRDGLGRPLVDVFPPAVRGDVQQMVAEAVDERYEPGAVFERQLELELEGERTAVLVATTPLIDEGSRVRGVVLFLEDVTHLLQVQRMEAWREVARRIAHEIKNPLTPIQLSAQRLRKRYSAQLQGDGGVFDECTRTIIQQVDDLKTLVNEFANFARLPKGERTPQDLNKLVDEALVLFREGHPGIAFSFLPAPALPVVELNRDGVKRVLINVLDNAVSACTTRPRAAGESGKVELRTAFDGRLGVVRVEVADDGIGMTAEVKARLGEAYFSTKPEGTGLGLAIVSEVVAEHQGFVRVRDNKPHGSRFILEFPVRRSEVPLVVAARRGARA